MTEDSAASKADELLALLIEHQPSIFPAGTLSFADDTATLATNLASLRKKLIEELAKQPE